MCVCVRVCACVCARARACACVRACARAQYHITIHMLVGNSSLDIAVIKSKLNLLGGIMETYFSDVHIGHL